MSGAITPRRGGAVLLPAVRSALSVAIAGAVAAMLSAAPAQAQAGNLPPHVLDLMHDLHLAAELDCHGGSQQACGLAAVVADHARNLGQAYYWCQMEIMSTGCASYETGVAEALAFHQQYPPSGAAGRFSGTAEEYLQIAERSRKAVESSPAGYHLSGPVDKAHGWFVEDLRE